MSRGVLAQLRSRVVRLQRMLGVDVGLVAEGSVGVKGVGVLNVSSPDDMIKELRRLQSDNVFIDLQSIQL